MRNRTGAPHYALRVTDYALPSLHYSLPMDTSASGSPDPRLLLRAGQLLVPLLLLLSVAAVVGFPVVLLLLLLSGANLRVEKGLELLAEIPGGGVRRGAPANREMLRLHVAQRGGVELVDVQMSLLMLEQR